MSTTTAVAAAEICFSPLAAPPSSEVEEVPAQLDPAGRPPHRVGSSVTPGAHPAFAGTATGIGAGAAVALTALPEPAAGDGGGATTSTPGTPALTSLADRRCSVVTLTSGGTLGGPGGGRCPPENPSVRVSLGKILLLGSKSLLPAPNLTAPQRISSSLPPSTRLRRHTLRDRAMRVKYGSNTKETAQSAWEQKQVKFERGYQVVAKVNETQ